MVTMSRLEQKKLKGDVTTESLQPYKDPSARLLVAIKPPSIDQSTATVTEFPLSIPNPLKNLQAVAALIPESVFGLTSTVPQQLQEATTIRQFSEIAGTALDAGADHTLLDEVSERADSLVGYDHGYPSESM
ncbi:UNVERIFIED_CONTAM: hypothetical protein HDU68_010119, partial [Siphonaria sp. JEL0065]